MNWTYWIASGSGLAGLAVMMGAFGAHALKQKLSPDLLQVFETAVRYHIYHALALLMLGLIMTRVESLALKLAGFAFLIGIILFSGSLYALCLSGHRALGIITPIGGAFFIAGWGLLTLAMLKV